MSEPLVTPEPRPFPDRLNELLDSPPPSRDATPSEEVTPEEVEPSDTEQEVSAEGADDIGEEEAQEPEEVAEQSLETEEGEPEAGDPLDIKNTNDLAEAFGVQQDELHQHLNVQVGEDSVPLADLIERAQAAPLAEQVAAAVAQEKEALRTVGQHQVEEFDKHTAAFVGVINLLIDDVLGGHLSEKAIAELKEAGHDQEYLVRSEDRRNVLARIDKAIGQAQEYQKVHKSGQAPAQTMSDEESAKALIEAVPEWKANPQRALFDAKIIGESIAARYNMSAEEVNAQRDPRWCLMARDAHAYHRLVEMAKEIKPKLDGKKIRARNTVIPTSARRPAENADAKKVAALRQRVRETAGDPNKKGEHDAASAQLLGRFLKKE